MMGRHQATMNVWAEIFFFLSGTSRMPYLEEGVMSGDLLSPVSFIPFLYSLIIPYSPFTIPFSLALLDFRVFQDYVIIT